MAKPRTRKLAPWSGPERWEKTHEGQYIWIEILPWSATERTLRNELGDRWTESVAEVELRRQSLRKAGNMMVKLGETRGAGSKPSLDGSVLEAAFELGRGRRQEPIRLTELRSRVQQIAPHHRTDFDEAVQRLHATNRVVLVRQDNNAALTSDDREDAIWVGEYPRHLVYLL